MYSPKYVDYLDEKRIESAFYNPKSKPKTWVGIISEPSETRINTGFLPVALPADTDLILS